jgi:hypothetical protein
VGRLLALRPGPVRRIHRPALGPGAVAHSSRRAVPRGERLSRIQSSRRCPRPLVLGQSWTDPPGVESALGGHQ